MAKDRFRTLEKVDGTWMFVQNPYADNDERLHFTPLWYPNGDYTVSVATSSVDTHETFEVSVEDGKIILR